ncbi:hypothetical protein [Sinorhizobium meliloti]|uniref:hypothetical protein n=1 Tax=Rhizobium meliloti TaxID=382 RepID=UPI001F40DB81|nr:hypothetical protein [Sinorhizobium meliloti]
MLKQFDVLPQVEKPRFLAELSGTPEGREVLGGDQDHCPRSRAASRQCGSAAAIDRINDVARLVDRTHRAELS